MDQEANVLESEGASIVTPEEKHLSIMEENYLGVLPTAGETEEREELSGSLIQPLLKHKQQHSPDEHHKVDTQTPTDGAGRKTSVPQELEFDGADQPRRSGSVRSQCSDNSSGGSECPICGEPFDSQGDHRTALLNCDHVLCHRCLAGILRRAKDPSRVQCPFCRQNTPLLQWEIQRMQDEVYFSSLCEPGPGYASGLTSAGPDTQLPEPQAVLTSPSCCFALEWQLEASAHRNICGCCMNPSCPVRAQRLIRRHSLCLFLSALLILILMLTVSFLHMDVPVKVLSVVLSEP